MKEVLRIKGTEYPMPENSLQERQIFDAERIKPNQIRHNLNLHGDPKNGVHGLTGRYHNKNYINGVYQPPKEVRK